MNKQKLLSLTIIILSIFFAACKTTSSAADNQIILSHPVDIENLQDLPTFASYPVPPENLEELIHTGNQPSGTVQTQFYGISKFSYKNATWTPSEEYIDAYIFDKKNNEYVCSIKNCYQQSVYKGKYNNETVWYLWSKDNAYYILNPSRYAICNENGFEYMSAWLLKTGLENVFQQNSQLGWEPQGELGDYYIYSKKQKTIVAVVRNCYKNTFWQEAKWKPYFKKAYRLVNSDYQQFYIDTSEYIICNQDGNEYINGYSYRINVPDVFSESIQETRGKVTVVAEPLRELYYICKRLSEYQGNYYTYDSTEYLDDINNYFADYKNHPAVVFLKEHSSYFEKDELSMTSPLYSIVDNKTLYGEDSYFNSGERFEHYAFFKMLVDFAEKSNYKTFFESHKDYYKSHVIENGFNSFGAVQKWNEEYLKVSKKTTYIIYMHRCEWANINADQELKEYKINLTVSKGNDGVGLAHELSHPALNSVMMKVYESDLQPRFDLLFNQNAGSIAVYGYPQPESYWCDGFVRAAAGVFYSTFAQEEYVKQYLDMQQTMVGFALVNDMYAKLKEFENAKYNSFEDLYNELYKFFDSKLPR